MIKLFVMSLFLSLSLSAEALYSFANVNINYLDWTTTTEEQTAQKDFEYLGVEGGIGWEGSDFYGFANVENFAKDARYSSYGDLDIKIANGFRFHIQNFNLRGDTFSVNDFVVGASYKYQSNFGLWFKPFLGIHITNDTYFDGFNGYTTGWLLNHDFKIYEARFSLFQWHEIEFARTKEFYEKEGVAIGDGKSYGLNGALSIWYYINEPLTLGLQYRYANNKLGNIGYQSALIYTLKYNF